MPKQEQRVGGLHNYDCVWPFRWRLKRDRLLIERQREGKLWSRDAVGKIEDGSPLYRRLTEAVDARPDGRVLLRQDWRRRAIDFANLYAPPVACDCALGSKHGFSVSHFGGEALLMWWALALQARIKAGDESDETLMAAVQIQALEPALGGVEMEWEYALRFSAWMPYQAPKTAHGVDRVAGQGYLPLPAASLHCLTPAEATRAVAMVYERHARLEAQLKEEFPQAARPALAVAPTLAGAYVLCSLLNIKLAGTAPYCEPTPQRTPGLRSGFLFATPRSRIWFGLWEDLGGYSIRFCEHCHRPFIPNRKDKRFCTTRCRTHDNVDRARNRQRNAHCEPP